MKKQTRLSGRGGRLLPKLLLLLLLIGCLAPLTVSAALTEAQKATLIAYTDKFLEDGNAAKSAKIKTGYLQYGIKEVWRTYQLFLSHNSDVYITNKQGKREKILYMMDPRGYRTYDAYLEEISGGKGGYLLEGDYLCLDCSAFTAWIYKAVFGLRFDYPESSNNSVRNWSTLMYLSENYAKYRQIYDKSRTTYIFKEIYFNKTATPSIAMSDLANESILKKLEVGDLIIGRNNDSGWGHIGFYGGDGYMYHSSSTPQILADGSLNTLLMRKQLLSEITNKSYTELRVYRINDGILPDDFDGWNVPVDFASLSTEKSSFDNTPPVFTSIEVSQNYSAQQTKEVTFTVSDEFGDMKPLYLADKTTVIRGSGYGESGILGIYTNDTGVLPDDLYEFAASKKTVYSITFGDGTHYIWVRDAAENVSTRFAVSIGETSKVTRQEADGSETLIATFSPSGWEMLVPLTEAPPTTTSPEVSDTDVPETTEPDPSGGPVTPGGIFVLIIAAAVISVVGVFLLIKFFSKSGKKEKVSDKNDTDNEKE